MTIAYCRSGMKKHKDTENRIFQSGQPDDCWQALWFSRERVGCRARTGWNSVLKSRFNEMPGNVLLVVNGISRKDQNQQSINSDISWKLQWPLTFVSCYIFSSRGSNRKREFGKCCKDKDVISSALCIGLWTIRYLFKKSTIFFSTSYSQQHHLSHYLLLTKSSPASEETSAALSPSSGLTQEAHPHQICKVSPVDKPSLTRSVMTMKQLIDCSRYWLGCDQSELHMVKRYSELKYWPVQHI